MCAELQIQTVVKIFFQGEIDSDLTTNMQVNNPEWGYKHEA
jgi:hypothetical protein